MPGKGFFRIDRRTCAAVCELGMNLPPLPT